MTSQVFVQTPKLRNRRTHEFGIVLQSAFALLFGPVTVVHAQSQAKDGFGSGFAVASQLDEFLTSSR